MLVISGFILSEMSEFRRFEVFTAEWVLARESRATLDFAVSPVGSEETLNWGTTKENIHKTRDA